MALKRQKYAPGSSDNLQHKGKSEKLYESARVEERGGQTRNAMWVKWRQSFCVFFVFWFMGGKEIRKKTEGDFIVL